MPCFRGRATLLITIALVTPLHGESPEPDDKKGLKAAEILAKVSQTYSVCRSYSDEGTVANRFSDLQGKAEKPEPGDRFTTAFVRPDQFNRDYRHNGASAAKRSVIWTEKEGARSWWDLDGQVAGPSSLDFALGARAGVTMSASTEISNLLLSPTLKKLPGRMAPEVRP
jgi:hypothetical protein